MDLKDWGSITCWKNVTFELFRLGTYYSELRIMYPAWLYIVCVFVCLDVNRRVSKISGPSKFLGETVYIMSI